MVDFRELDFEDMPEWPLLPQLLAIGALVIVLQVVGAWFYLSPQQDELEQIRQQEVTLKSSIRIKAAKVAALPQLQAQLDELNTRYQYLLKQLPVQKELASMLSSVNDIGIKNDLSFTRVDWGEKQVQEFLYRLPLNIELTGAYNDIAQFSEAVAKLPRIISLHNVEWQRVSQESSTLHFRVRAYTYQFKPEDGQ
ncbi:type 4a pilus biogenesis protein PilO [Vibrio sp. CK2-1]|uniref:type 4a pilus biogenesis protein PilO n=1 Tax=Vibrio sp. CK2-1 TaxID=2912249 RepID=UPI001F027605|nr:type 4a pilus biogenesis protein PilO [Vibrio sp. CK2-1]MCF7353599.1 type 4a pilus biogenesis protein PilO [Vibrio sp. CK2-1]